MIYQCPLEPSFKKHIPVFCCCICGFEIYQGEAYYSVERGSVCIDCTVPYLHSIRQVANCEN